MLCGNVLRDAVLSAANHLTNQRKRIDDLNVFPVPDGDTGTNMSMTLSNAARELERLENATVSTVAQTTAAALLRGARGNSGVITSLLFRGFAGGMKEATEITPENLCRAFSFGVEGAYKAVMKPTEGTILTVARVASEYAEQAQKKGADAIGVFEKALEGARVALAQTPDLLEPLKKAGVVDAGGQGLVIIMEGMLSVLKDGVIIPGQTVQDNSEPETGDRNAAGEYEAEITFTYCTEFIINRDPTCEKQPADLRRFLENIGDCVVVVDDEEIIKVHVHTDHPGQALEEAITFGQMVHLKIENMRDQHERAKHDAENGIKKPAMNQERTAAIESVAPEKPVGFVSVCAGDGLTALFGDLGVDQIVSGGQTMNPSTDDILRAIEATPAETVFVLPNNKNIIMAAEQAIPLSTRKVIVVHSRTIPQGIAALLAFDGEADDDTNAIAMRETCDRITTGQVTFAARDSEYDGKKIRQGDMMAMVNGKIVFTDADLTKCVTRLVHNTVKKDSQFLTVIYGADVAEEDAHQLESELNDKYGNKLEITFVNGGQPIYYYILSVE